MGTALITGASSGIGLEFARQLAGAGHNLVLVARSEARLNEVADTLRSDAGVKVEVLPADLGEPADLARVAARLRVKSATPNAELVTGGEAVHDGAVEHDGASVHEGSAVLDRETTNQIQTPIDLLVNNAGFGTAQPLVGGDINKEIGAINVMVTAVMVLSQAAAEAMVERGRGAIVNIGSIAALATMGTYSAAKAWVRTFTEALAAELAGTGVTATVVAPGLTHTEFHERSGMRTDNFPAIGWLDAQQVVAEALADVRRGAVHSTPSWRYKAVAAGLRAAPRGVIRALGNSGFSRKPAD